MQRLTTLIPLDQIELQSQQLLSIQRDELLPLLDNQILLNQYAESVVQAQARLLRAIDPALTQSLSQAIAAIIVQLSNSNRKLKHKRFNRLQQWLGRDLEFDVGKVHYIQQLDQFIEQANQYSQRLSLEIEQSQSRYQQAINLRVRMAHYIVAAEQFLHDCPQFIKNQPMLDYFPQRLAQKIHSLKTLQSSHDIAMAQMQLSQQLAFGLIDRFKEAQQVLIPAWQYHLRLSQSKQDYLQQHMKNPQAQNATVDFDELDRNRDKLIQSLKQTLENS